MAERSGAGRDAASIWQTLVSGEIEDVETVVEWLPSDLLDELARALPAALRGDERAVRDYVAGYGDLTSLFLLIGYQARHRELTAERPGELMHGEVRVVDLSVGLWDEPGARRSWRSEYQLFWTKALDAPADERAVLLYRSAQAPFSPWTQEYGLERGMILFVIDNLRALVPDAKPLREPSVTARIDVEPSQLATFMRRVAHHVERVDRPDPLEQVMRAFDLTKKDTGDLFGVSRQAVDRWLRERRVPADKQEKLTALVALTELLQRKLKPGRLPGVARRASAAYGRKTMLDLIREDRHGELLESTRASFDWSQAA